MSTAEKERGLLKKREGLRAGGSGNSSGKPKVVESKNEKKRLLVLSDSESDGHLVSPRRKVAPGADQSGSSSAIRSRNGMGRIKREDEIKVVGKRITRSDAAKQREGVNTDKDKVMESGLVRKRNSEASDAESPAKKYKTQCRRDEKTEVRKNQVLDSKPVVSDHGLRDGPDEKRIQGNSNKASSSDAEKVRWIVRSGQRPLRMLKDRSTSSGISNHKDVRVQGKGGILKVLPGTKKVGVLKKSHIRREAKENRKSSGSAKKNRYLEGKKTEPKVLSSQMQLKRVVSSNSNTESPVKDGNSSNSKIPMARSVEKQKVRDQIKNILLNAGWKIDLRPRKGRDYEDAVYIPPEGPGSHWSITKAYDAYLDQLKRSCKDNGKELSGESSKQTTGSNIEGTSTAFSTIPTEVLSILKKNIVNKRRSKKELESAKKKLGVARSKKAKEASNMKYMKKKHHLQPGRKNKNQRGNALLVRGANQEAETDTDNYVPYVGKRTVFSWMIDLGILPASGKVKYMNSPHTQTILEGWITRDGIHCSCCSKILTVSNFEIHAGSKVKQPYENIYVDETGISLLQCQLNSWEKQEESERQGFYSIDTDGDDPNDDTCGICADGGDLICCDGCPSTFHLTCLGIQMLPPGEWLCTNCSCKFCGAVSGDAAQENDVTASPLLVCSQCEEKYHQKCAPEADVIPVGSNSSCTSFCGPSCKKLYEQLQKFLGIKNDLEAGFSWTLIQRCDENSSTSFHGPAQRAECNSKIAVALAVMDECFLPIVDQRSGINLIHNVLYNCRSNFNRLNYSGFYTFVLERGDEIISAASIRIHGTRLAEMPFIGTRNMYRRQGMCRILLNGIESVLCSLSVEKLIIPAISELLDTWTTVFGFKPLEAKQKQEVKSINMLVFPGTGLLQKPMLKKESSECYTTADAASEEVIVKDVEPSFSAFGGSIQSTSEQLPESSDAPMESSGTAGDASVFLHQDAVCHGEPVLGNNCHVDSPIEPKVEFHCEGIVPDNRENTQYAGVLRNLHAVDDTSINHISEVKCRYPDNAVDDTSIKHTSEVKCRSPDTTASTLGDSGGNSVPSPHAADGTSLHHTFGSQCTYPDSIASTCQNSCGNIVHLPKSCFDGTCHYESEVTRKTSAASPLEHNVQASSEHIVDDSHDVKVQFASLQPNIKAFGSNSGHCSGEITSEPLDVVPDNFLASSIETNIHAVGADTVHDIHDVKAEIAVIETKPYAIGPDAEQDVSENIYKPADVAHVKEIPASCGSNTHDSDIVTKPACAASGHNFLASEARSTMHDSKMLQEPPECPCNAVLFTMETSRYSKYDSVNQLHVHSLPEPDFPSNGGDMLHNSHETNNDACSFKQNPGSLSEKSAKSHTSDIGGESLNFASESNIIFSSRGKVSEVPGECPGSRDVTYPLTADADNPHMVTKDSAVFVHGASPDCHNERLGNASVDDDHATAEASEHCAAEGITGFNGVAFYCNDVASGPPLNKLPDSTSFVSQFANGISLPFPVELSHVSLEGAHDTNDL